MLRRAWRSIRRRIQPHRYFLIDTDTALFRFASPADDWQIHVHEEMLRLPVTDIDEWDHLEALEAASVVGDAKAVLDRLGEALSEDFDDLTVGPEPWDRGFDYVIMIEPGGRVKLHVLTRLFTGIKNGASCYGRVIQRLDHDKYALWVHD